MLVGWTLSMAVGVSLAAWLADVLHWRAVFVLLSLVAMVLVLTTVRLQQPVVTKAISTIRGSALSAFGIPGVTSIMFACTAYMMAFYGTYGYIGDHIVNHLLHLVKSTGLITVACGLGFSIAALGDQFIDRYGADRLFPWTFSGISITYIVIAAVSGSLFYLVASSFVWGVMNHLGLNLMVAKLSAIDPERRGRILGLYSAVTYFALTLGTLVYGALYDCFGISMIAVVSGGLLLFAVVHALAMRKGKCRRQCLKQIALQKSPSSKT